MILKSISRRLLFKSNTNFLIIKQSKYYSQARNLAKKASYLVLLTFGTSAGLLVGYVVKPNNKQISNESLKSLKDTKIQNLKFNSRDSPYKSFPFKLTLFKYERCEYCEQLKSYLDFFGFEYEEVYGDNLNKINLSSKQINFPLCLIEDKITHKKWYLSNATTIISALESLRNENYDKSHTIIRSYLPMLNGQNLIYTKKYIVSEKSSLNDVSLRKWINNVVIPTFKWNSSSTLSNSFETIDFISKSNEWNDRLSYLKCLFIYFNAVYKLYQERNNYKKLLNTEMEVDALNALDDVISKWENQLSNDENNPFSSIDGVTLADLSLYGVIRAFIGFSFVDEAFENHKKFSNWYKKINLLVETHSKNGKRFINESVDWMAINKKDMVTNKEKNIEEVENKECKEIQQENIKNVPNDDSTNKSTQNIPFRVLSLTYLVHVLAFTYASFMKSN